MIDAAGEVISYVKDVAFDDFVAESMRRNATIQQLSVIGEAAGRLTPDFRDRHSSIDWPVIIAFRNVLVHGYFRLSWTIVWDTATTDIPALLTQLVELLDEKEDVSTGEETT